MVMGFPPTKILKLWKSDVLGVVPKLNPAIELLLNVPPEALLPDLGVKVT